MNGTPANPQTPGVAQGRLKLRTRLRPTPRQMVLFCVERRKSWRLLQSKAGVENLEYKAQRSLLARVDVGEIELDEFRAHLQELLQHDRSAQQPTS